MKTYELTNNEEISPEVHVISFKRDFEFIPGQVVKINLPPGQVPRIYSICSGNIEDEVRDLFIEKGIPFNKIFAEIYF